MDIQKNKQDSSLKLMLSGRLDTTTAPSLEAVVREELTGVKELEFDLSGLEYISSAGLRVILTAQKSMMRQGLMTVSHVNEDIREIFDITGFTDILTFAD